MCGIYFSSQGESPSGDEKFLTRGPDHFKEETYEKYTLSHSLLSLTGEFTPQPIENSKVKLIFNGQIYNYDEKKYSSDSYFILDQFLKDEKNFWKKLDGEYAILIFDPNKQKVFFLTDVFGTKPLYYSLDNKNLAVSSLKSTLLLNGYKNIIKCKPNTIYSYDLVKNYLNTNENYYEFELEQYKDTFDDWSELFLNSVYKRFNNLRHEIILPLSSGHDSGAIGCAFDILGIKYYTYSFFRKEDFNVLSKRLLSRVIGAPLKTRFKISLSNKNTRKYFSNHIENNCDPYFYGPEIDQLTINGHEDPGSIGLAYILGMSKKMNKNIKIVASGQGGDEIYSTNQNYTFEKPNPNIFDNNLKDIFPWQNVFYGAQMSYLNKEESIGGSFGLETRYPFLDIKLVQEYLSLIPKLKNKYYKSPITNFLIENNYPTRQGNKKSGFNP